MRLVRAFSSSVRRGRQPLFEIENRPLSAAEKTSLQIRNRLNHYANPWIARDARTLRRALFRSGLNERHEARSDLTRRVALALAKLQDPRSFQVEDMTLDTIFRLPCLSHPSELGIMDRYNPLGVPPDTPKEAIPPIHDPSLVAQALSEAGFTGSFLQFDRTRVATEDLQLSAGSLTEPWPTYKHIPHGGYVYPPRLLVDAGPTLDSITLTLPGVSIKPLYNLFKWFHRNVGSFKSVFELVTLWAQSHGIPLTSQSIALMIIASMQNEEPLFDDYDEKQGWAPVDCREDKLKWYQAVGPVYVDFKEARVLAGQHSSVPEDYIGFFRHWRHRLPKTWYSAFSVRKGAGALNQLIHRQYNSAKPRAADFRFSESELDDPTTDFIPWCYDCLVIQDPFLITHNHAENLSAVDIRSLGQEIERTFDSLHAGKPLSWSFGKRLVPPGSKAETKILNEPKFYSAVLNLVQRDRVPGHLLQSDSMAAVEDTRPPLAPPETRRKNVRPPRVPWDSRGFHASSVSLAKRGGFNNSSIASPEPVRPRRSHRGIEGSASGWGLKGETVHEPRQRPTVAEDSRTGWGLKAQTVRDPRGPPRLSPTEVDDPVDGWGFKPPTVREPTFWRPGREPLQLPTRDGSTSPVPSVRETRAGVAYKSRPSTGKEFHTSAVHWSRHAPTAREEERGVDERVLASRMRTLRAVEKTIRKQYGNQYSVELFGSTRYGISSPSSDLDMVILDPALEHGFTTSGRRLPPIYNIKKLAGVLRKAGFKVIDTIAGAAVPIVIFQDPQTGHSCDINVNDRLGMLNSDLIRRYCELNPVLVDMVLYIKKWAKPLGLNAPSSRQRGPVTFSSYALVMMTIGFLQHRGLLPNLQEGLAPLNAGQLKGTFWLRQPTILRCDVRYNLATGWTPPEDVPVHQLMHHWFNFWAMEFDYDAEMISIRQGGRIWRSTVPEPMEFRGFLWNIDPFIRTKNLTQNLTYETVIRFKLDCYRFAKRVEFEGGLPSLSGLPRPPKIPKDVVTNWLPVDDDEMPMPWRDAPLNPAETDTELLTAINPGEPSDTVHSELEKLQGALPPAWSEPLPDTPASTSITGAPVLPSSAEEEVDPTIPVDDYGRPIEQEKPPKQKYDIRRRLPIANTSSWATVEEDELPVSWRSERLIMQPSEGSRNLGVISWDTTSESAETSDKDIQRPYPDSGASTDAYVDALPSNTQDESPDYDPTIRFDDYGRPIQPNELPPPPKILEADEAGWGFKAGP